MGGGGAQSRGAVWLRPRLMVKPPPFPVSDQPC